MNALVENRLLIDFDVDNPTNPFARLKELGTKGGVITYDDILRLFPEAEQDVVYLDQIYIAIRDAGIKFVEKDRPNNAPNGDTEDEDGDEADGSGLIFKGDNLLSNLEPDNLVGCISAKQLVIHCSPLMKRWTWQSGLSEATSPGKKSQMSKISPPNDGQNYCFRLMIVGTP